MSIRRGSNEHGQRKASPGARILVRTAALGGMLLQAAVGGCEQALEDASAALVQTVLGGIGEGLGDLAQVAVIGAFL